MNHRAPWKVFFSTLVGNIAEHYDQALFGLMAPFLAPLFFPMMEPLPALILTYAILPLGLLFRPLGALFFGWIGDHLGRRHALLLSMLGMGIVTGLMGCLPTFAEVGIIAPILLAAGKTLQTFCVAGEWAGSALFILEQTPKRQHNLFSSLFNLSTMLGVLLASGMINLIAMGELVSWFWRVPFWVGGLTAFTGLLLRFHTKESAEFLQLRQKQTQIPWKELWSYRQALFSVMIAVGFSFANYAVAFTFMNGFLPLVTSYTRAEVLQFNSLLLFLDMLLLPVFGWIANRIGRHRLMFLASLGMSLLVVPLFNLIALQSLALLITMRTLFMILGVGFSAPLQAWSQELLPTHLRYTGLSLATALGAQVIGLPATSAMLWLYHTTQWVVAPALYLLLSGGLMLWVLMKEKRVAAKQEREHPTVIGP